MKYKLIVLLGLVAFAVSLAIVVGQRMSAEAMAVIIGVVAGVSASIPTSLIVVWFALRLRAPEPQPVEARVMTEREPRPAEPRIVVVAPPAPQPSYAPSGYGRAYDPGMLPMAALPRQPMQRRFTVIGGEAEEVVL